LFVCFCFFCFFALIYFFSSLFLTIASPHLLIISTAGGGDPEKGHILAPLAWRLLQLVDDDRATIAQRACGVLAACVRKVGSSAFADAIAVPFGGSLPSVLAPPGYVDSGLF
jgi:hypothetical protein